MSISCMDWDGWNQLPELPTTLIILFHFFIYFIFFISIFKKEKPQLSVYFGLPFGWPSVKNCNQTIKYNRMNELH